MNKYRFDEEKHIHYLDEKPLFGTTTVLGIIDKPQLVQWAADVATVNALEGIYPDLKQDYETAQALTNKNDKKKARSAIDKKYPLYHQARTAHRKKKEDAATWGTIVHKAIEIWIKTTQTPDLVDIGGKQCQILPEHRIAIDQFIGWAIKNNVEFLQSELGIYSLSWWTGGIVDFVCMINGKRYIGDIKTSSDIYESYWLQTAAYAKKLIEMGLYDSFHGMTIVNLKKNGEFNVEERTNIKEDAECFEAALTLYKRFKQNE